VAGHSTKRKKRPNGIWRRTNPAKKKHRENGNGGANEKETYLLRLSFPPVFFFFFFFVVVVVVVVVAMGGMYTQRAPSRTALRCSSCYRLLTPCLVCARLLPSSSSSSSSWYVLFTHESNARSLDVSIASKP
jgi:hypothetical protein